MKALQNLQKLAERRRFGIKPGLDTIQALLLRLQNPERELAVIHIAGTNGKGSVAAMCESVLRHAGYQVGRYTSPHLISLNERFLINGSPVSDAALVAAVETVESHARAVEETLGVEVTFFEFLTAVALLLFRKHDIRLAVLETGLGGRWDATNVVVPVVAVITRIALDHCAWLGNSLATIAAEKAGIIKAMRPVVCGAMSDEARAIIAAVAAKKNAFFVDVAEAITVRISHAELSGQTLQLSSQDRQLPPLKIPLAGAFQAENACTALAALDCVAACGVAIPDEAVVAGLGGVCWPGRFQLVAEAPPVIIDGAHNPDGARALRMALKGCGVKSPVGVVAGFCGDKDILSFVRELAPIVKRAWTVRVPNARSISAEEAVGVIRMAGVGPVDACVSLCQALAQAREWATEHDGVVVVCGSLFLAGEALRVFGAYPWPVERTDENELVQPIDMRPVPGETDHG